MKLLKLKLSNFRQFYGAHTIEFATDRERNVTLLRAENGIGKTTLLNSVMWCLYEQVTKKFEHREQILNFEAAAEGQTMASVEVTLEHDGHVYVMQRHYSQKGSSRGEVNFSGHKLERGILRQLDAPDTFVNSIVPSAMAKYFFFDGEHAETFASEANFRAVGEAIKNMLGCDLAKTAIEDLENASKFYSQNVGKLPGDDELTELGKRLDEYDDKLARANERLAKVLDDEVSLNDQIAQIEEGLRNAAAAKHLQRERDDKRRQLDETTQSLLVARQNIVKWIGNKTLPLVANRIATETLSFIDEESLRGRIPSPYNEDFVQGLLKAQTCICGRELNPATPEWRLVTELLRNASNAELLGKVVRARSRIQVFRELREQTPSVFTHERSRIGSLEEKEKTLERQLGELDEQIKTLPIAEIAEREGARQRLKKRLSDSSTAKGALQIAIQQIERAIRETRADQAKLSAKNAKAKQLIERRDFAQSAADLLQALLQNHEINAKEVITKKINDILDRTARRAYQFRFKDNFAMDLAYADGRTVPKSGGENQLMSLAFIAALVQFSEERSGTRGSSPILIPGTVAPLVLDSPFGQLDETYRRDTAAFIPYMASQVVLLLSSSQADPKVMEALKPFIGKDYVLISENREPRGDKPEDILNIKNKRIAMSLFNCPKNLTRIETIN